MHSLAPETDVRAMHVVVEDARWVVDWMDGRTIAGIAKPAIRNRAFSIAKGAADAV